MLRRMLDGERFEDFQAWCAQSISALGYSALQGGQSGRHTRVSQAYFSEPLFESLVQIR